MYFILFKCSTWKGTGIKFTNLGHPYFVGVQFHPEFKSRPFHPSAPYLGLILASCGKLSKYLENGNRLSPR